MPKQPPPTKRSQPETITITNAPTVHGDARGRDMNVPTINIDLSAVPAALEQGIYACRVLIGRERFAGALHYGPRPVFQGGVSCEVHLLDATIPILPAVISLEIIERIRDVKNFPSKEELIKQISEDIKAVRGILGI